MLFFSCPTLFLSPNSFLTPVRSEVNRRVKRLMSNTKFDYTGFPLLSISLFVDSGFVVFEAGIIP